MKTVGHLCPWHNMTAEHVLLFSTGDYQRLLRYILSRHDMPADTGAHASHVLKGIVRCTKLPTDLTCDVSIDSMSSDLLQVATLEQQVANLERQRQQEAASLRGSAEHMQREMQGHCTNLQAQLDAFQVPFIAASRHCHLLLPCTPAFHAPSTAACPFCLSLLPFTCLSGCSLPAITATGDHHQYVEFSQSSCDRLICIHEACKRPHPAFACAAMQLS